jgi:hypothetical protein
MSRYTRRLFSTLSPLLFLTACTSPLEQRITTIVDPDDIEITDLRSAVGPNKLLVAQVTFHNTSRSAVTGFYRCQFYDPNKMTVGDPQVWQSITVYPNEHQVAKCMANHIEATDFRVEYSEDGNKVSVTRYK